MFNTLKSVALSAIVGLGILAAIPASAQADSVRFRLGDGDARFGLTIHDAGHSYRRWDRDYDRRWDRDHRRWDRDRHHRRHWDGDGYGRRCSPGRALNKAERLGVRRARIGHVNHYSIGVSGRKYGDRVYVTFARAPHCPIIGY